MAEFGPNIRTVYAMINNQKVLASYDPETQTYTVETDAPAESSWSQPEHVFHVTLHAEDEAGNTAEMDSTDPTYGEQLKIRVIEKTSPTVTITGPTESSVFGEDQVTLMGTIYDEGGSDINVSSVTFNLDAQGEEPLEIFGSVGNYSFSKLLEDLSDGLHTIVVTATDNDGNTASSETVTFAVSTVAPSLVIASPMEGLITNQTRITVTGTAKAGSTVTSIASLTINGQTVEVDPYTGEFEYEVDITEGRNEIVIIVTDSIGKTTQVVRTIYLDTEVPIITDVVAEALTVNAGERIRITFKVTENDPTTEG